LLFLSDIFINRFKKIAVLTNLFLAEFNKPLVYIPYLLLWNRIGGVMVNVLASSGVDRGLEPRSDQTKVYEISICCFSAKNTSLRSKKKNWLVRNQNKVSEWSDLSIVSES